MIKKRCCKCGIEKPIIEFSRQNRRKCVVKDKCIQCRHNESANRWYVNNKEKALEIGKRWELSHPETVKKNSRAKNARRRNTVKGKLSHCVSSAIHSSLKKGTKGNRHWELLVSYTIDQLKQHLEKQFTEGMTWENYGRVWHIDHKIPIAVFNYEKPEDIDFRLCWSLKNLQPLSMLENIKKGARIEKPFQPSLQIAV